jgi:hypothetical protein
MSHVLSVIKFMGGMKIFPPSGSHKHALGAVGTRKLATVTQ